MTRSKQVIGCLFVLALIPLMGQDGGCGVVPSPDPLPGTDGVDGLDCWDLNGNGTPDPATEDTNGDGLVNIDDCRGNGDSGFTCADCAPDYVNEDQADSISTAMIQDEAVSQSKLAAIGASDGYVLKTDGIGMYWGEGGGNTCEDCDERFVNEGQPNSITSAMIADAAVTLPRIDTSDAQANQIMKFVDGQLVWAADEIDTPCSGDITAVYADDGLTGGAMSGDAHLSVDAGWADGRYVNEGQANSITSAMIADSAVGSSEIGYGAVGSSEVNDNSLTASDLAADSVGLSELNASGGSSGRYLKHTGNGMLWADLNGGGVDGGGTGGHIPKFTGPTTLSDSVIYADDNYIGIGTTSPDEMLHVTQSIQAGLSMYAGDDVEAGGRVYSNGDIVAEGDIITRDDATVEDKLWVYGDADIDGYVSIGATVSPSKRLYVHGSSDEVALWVKGSGIAGHFEGDVGITGDLTVAGTLSKSSGTFKIDHPLDPENMYLSHSFVESPDMMNVYNGNVCLDSNGEAIVILPDWFDALNRDYRYQLTCVGSFAPVYVAHEIANNQFAIAGGTPGLKISWQVTGIRDDAYARTHPIVVEETKAADERGSYLNPEAFGQPQSRSVEHALHPDASRLGE